MYRSGVGCLYGVPCALYRSSSFVSLPKLTEAPTRLALSARVFHTHNGHTMNHTAGPAAIQGNEYRFGSACHRLPGGHRSGSAEGAGRRENTLALARERRETSVAPRSFQFQLYGIEGSGFGSG